MAEERLYWDTEYCDHCQGFCPGGVALVEFPEDEIMLCEPCADHWEE